MNASAEDSELSELTDFEEPEVVLQSRAERQQQPAAAAAAEPSQGPSTSLQQSRESSGAPPRERQAARKSKESTRNNLTVPKANLKRSSAEAELEPEQPSAEFTSKKQKLADAVTRDAADHQESNEREAPFPPGRTLRGSSRLNLANTPTLPASGPAPTGGVADGSDQDSPLSSPASSQHGLPPGFQPKLTGKRAKTKQS